MKTVNLKYPRPQSGQEERVARLVRHLDARLHDLALGWPEVLEADQEKGSIAVRFPGQDARSVLAQLEGYGVSAALSDGHAVFFLSPDLSFEALDHVWGALFELLPPKYQ